MKTVSDTSHTHREDRKALRKRIREFYKLFNRGDWSGCLAFLDPRLIAEHRVSSEAYSLRLQEFKNCFGLITPRWIRIFPVPEGAPRQGDPRVFAYAVVVWQDAQHRYHVFQERWVKEDGEWFSRVVGLIPDAMEESRATTPKGD